MDESTLNDLLECSVCLERLNSSSKVLPCQHTFCRKCLEVIYASRQELRCPECRILVETKIENLPPNVLLMRILEGLKSAVSLDKSSPQVVPQQQQQKQQQQQQQQQSLEHTVCEKAVPPIEKRSGDHNMEKPVHHRQGAVIPVDYNSVVSIPHGIALYDYESHEKGTLKFKRGDTIRLKRKLDNLWYIGEIQHVEGVFPINLIHIKIPLPMAKCVALYDFQMGPSEDEGCLRFSKGTVIQVLRRVDNNWAEGQIGPTIGIFPIEFVELNITAREMLKSSRLQSQQIGISSKDSRKSLQSTELSANIMVSKNNVPMRTRTEGSVHPSNSYRRHSLNNIRSEGFTDECGSSLLPTAGSQLNRNSMDTLLYAASDTTNRPGMERNSNNPGRLSTTNDLSKRLPPPLPPCLPWAYMALYPYKPRKADELELKKGCIYLVIQRCMDGWFKGVNAEDVNGVFPGNYVVPLKATANQQHILSNWKSMSAQVSSMSEGTHQTNAVRFVNVPAHNRSTTLIPQSSVETVSNTRNTIPQAPDKTTAQRCKSPTTGCLLSSSNTVANSALGSTNSTINGLRKLLTHIKTRSKSPNNTLEEVDNGSKGTATEQFIDNMVNLQPHRMHNTINVHHSRSGSCPSQLQATPCKDMMSMASQNPGTLAPVTQLRIEDGSAALVYRHQRQHSQQPFYGERTMETATAIADGRSDSATIKSFAEVKHFYRKEDTTPVK